MFRIRVEFKIQMPQMKRKQSVGCFVYQEVKISDITMKNK